jgi:hypothetical protein
MSVVKVLEELVKDVQTITSRQPEDMFNQYRYWSLNVIERFSTIISPYDLADLVQTHGHWQLQEQESRSPLPFGTADRVRVELEALRKAFEAGRVYYEQLNAFWGNALVTHVIALDTNAYLHRQQPFYEEDWLKALRTVLALTAVEQVHIFIPMQVIRELDRQKRTGKNSFVDDTKNELVSTRARTTIREITALFRDNLNTRQTLAANVTVELVLDDLAHKRLDDPDSEIIDRLVAVQNVIGRPIYFLSEDAFPLLLAQSAGLKVLSPP